MIDGPILVMTAWLAGVATGISAARLSSWIHHIRSRGVTMNNDTHGSTILPVLTCNLANLSREVAEQTARDRIAP